MQKKAVILFSGGLDSTTCVAMAKAAGFACYALSFDYDQRHAAELLAARNVASTLGVVEHRVVHLSGLGALGGSALTDVSMDVPDYQVGTAIPMTYVPARNTIFLSYALAYAEVLGAFDVFLGINAIDYSNYPDCRPEYLDAFQKMANLATRSGVEGQHVTLHAPLLHLSKADIIQRGLALGIDYGQTVSCYQSTSSGEACGRCDSCVLRRQAFAAVGVPDPTKYAGC